MPASVVGFVGQHVDRLVVGFFLGATDLGIFGMARKIVNSGSNGLTGVINNVVMSILSRQQDDHDRENHDYAGDAPHKLDSVSAFGGMIVVAPDLVRTMLRSGGGDDCRAQVLCLNGMWQCMTFYLFTTLRALGKRTCHFGLAV
jgi:O-antigen/teichoic acid export membrane protein